MAISDADLAEIVAAVLFILTFTASRIAVISARYRYVSSNFPVIPKHVVSPWLNVIDSLALPEPVWLPSNPNDLRRPKEQ